MSFRAYLTDCLRVLSMGKQYAGTIERWADIAAPERKRRRDNRTGTEIALDVIKRAGLVVT